MTNIETAIDTNTAEQVDFIEALETSRTAALDTLITKASATKRLIAMAERKRSVVSDKQAAVLAARDQMDAANEMIQRGNMSGVDDLTGIISNLRRANNALDKALESFYEAEAEAEAARVDIAKIAALV